LLSTEALPVCVVTVYQGPNVFTPSSLLFIIYCLKIVVILQGVGWQLILILIYISPMTGDVEHLFKTSFSRVQAAQNNKHRN
jgi:hypothetical protein